MRIEYLTGFGRRHAALGANQQLLIQLVLQRGDLLTERRLRDVQHFSRLRQTANIDDFHKVLQSS